jgi:hypothetical protein
MFQITSETWSANSAVKTAVNTMQTGSLISGFLPKDPASGAQKHQLIWS